jgi:hypothetical protein
MLTQLRKEIEMKKNLLLVTLCLVLLTGLQACTTMRCPVNYPEKMVQTFEELDARATVLITGKGELLFYDTKGNPLETCVLPAPDGKTPAAGKGSVPVCKGMEKGSAVTSIQDVSIIKTNSLHCVTLGPDGGGYFYEICWEYP